MASINIWVVLATICFKPVWSATFTTVHAPLSCVPIITIPRPDNLDETLEDDTDANVTILYEKATIYDYKIASGETWNIVKRDVMDSLLKDLKVQYNRGKIDVSTLPVKGCSASSTVISIADITRVTGKTVEDLKGNVNPLTLEEIHDIVVQTMEDIYCFDMGQLETQLGLDSLSVDEAEWSLFSTSIVTSAIKCRADSIGVSVSELAELLRVSASAFNGYSLQDLSNTFFPSFDNLKNRKALFEATIYDASYDRQQALLHWADNIGSFTSRDLEILYRFSKSALFAVENIPLRIYEKFCTLNNLNFLQLTEMFSLTGLTSCTSDQVFALSRSLNEVQSKYPSITSTSDKNALELFRLATGEDDWFSFDDTLQLNDNEGIWIEIPDVTHVAAIKGVSTSFMLTCSIPQVIDEIEQIKAANNFASLSTANKNEFRTLLLSTYGYTLAGLSALKSTTSTALSALTIQELHEDILDVLENRYSYTTPLLETLDKSDQSTLPSFEWDRIVRKIIEQSFIYVARALSTNIAALGSDLNIATLADGSQSVTYSGTDVLSPLITTDVLATCLLSSSEATIYGSSLPVYHSLYSQSILPIATAKTNIETKTLTQMLAEVGLSYSSQMSTNVGQTLTQITGMTLDQLACLYGWDDGYKTLLNTFTWNDVRETRICSDFEDDVLYTTLTNLETATVKNCFATVSLSQTSYSVTEGNGQVAIGVELTLGTASSNGFVVSLQSQQSTAIFGSDFSNPGTLDVTYVPGESGPKLVFFPITTDSVLENDEQFTVSLTTASSFLRIGDGSAIVTIVDDDAVNAVIEMDDQNVPENAGIVSPRIVLSAVAEKDVVVSFSLPPSPDFTVLTASPLTFTPGQTSQAFSIQITDDNIVEVNEPFAITLSSEDPDVSTSNSLLIITDNDQLQISLSSTSYQVTESESSVLVEVLAVGQLSTDVTVGYETTNDDAIAGNDYVAADSTVTFQSHSENSITKSFTITIRPDDITEGTERFQVSLLVPAGDPANANRFQLSNPSVATVFIQDDDQVNVRFQSATYVVAEFAGTLEVDVVIQGAFQTPISVSYTAQSTTASSSDYQLAPGTLVFQPGGVTVQTISLTVTQDSIVEANEEFEITLIPSNVALAGVGSPGVATVSIIDDDDVAVVFTESTYEFPENQGSASIGVTLTGMTNPLEKSITVSISVLQGSAEFNKDYGASSGSVTFNVGDLNEERFVTVPILEDTLYEGPETFTLALVDSSVVDIGTPGQATVTITDNDNVLIGFSPTSYDVDEGDTATVTVKVLSGQLGTQVTVSVQTTGASAISGQDFTDGSTGLTFSASQTTRTFNVLTIEDTVVEETETIIATLSSQSGITSTNNAVISIQDDDSLVVEFKEATQQVSEGDGVVNIIITATGTTAIPLSLSFTTQDVTALAGFDYSSTTQTVTFDVGSTEENAVVSILENLSIEVPETFLGKLTAISSRVTIGAVDTTEITIVDNDFATVQFTTATFEGLESAGFIDVSLIVTGVIENDVIVSVSTVAQTATQGVDYDSLTNFGVTFTTSGTKTVRVTVNDDNVAEGSERFLVSVNTNQPTTQIGTIETATVRIIDDDVATLSFTQTDITLAEGTSGILTVAMTGPTLKNDVSATIQVTPGTAGSGDYTVSNTNLVFTESPSQKTVSIPTIQDNIIEADERFTLDIIETSNLVTVSDGQAQVTITNDDEATVSFSSTLYSVSEDQREVVITVNIAGTLETPVIVGLSLNADTATQLDYGALSSTQISFSSGGATSQTVTIPIVDDNAIEAAESFSVNLVAVSNNVDIPSSVATVTISDNDFATIGFQSTNYDVNEPDGSVDVVVVLTASAPLQRPVIFSYTSPSVDATPLLDYQSVSGAVAQFDVGDGNGASYTINVPIINDKKTENTETFEVRINAFGSDSISSGTATVSILDDDVPTVAFTAATMDVGESDGIGSFRVTVSGDRLTNVEASVQSVSTGASSGVDFEQVLKEITFTPSDVLRVSTFTINTDSLIEGPETFDLVLTSSNANVGTPNRLTVTITDDDSLTVAFDTSTVNVDESAGVAQVVMTLTGTLAIPVSFQLGSQAASATNVNDYSYTDKTINVPVTHPAQLTENVVIVDDAIVENTEQFNMLLSSTTPNLFTFTNSPMTIQIQDDDRGVVEFAELTKSVGEGDTSVDVKVKCPSNSNIAVTARVSTAASTADGSDFVPISNQLVTCASSDTEVTVTVSISDDQAVENQETFSLILSDGGNSKVVIGAGNTVIILIEDDDSASVQFTKQTYSFAENVGTTSIDVQLTCVQPLQRSLSFRVSAADISALLGSDYTTSTAVYQFDSGSSNGDTKSVSFITLIDDNRIEDSETLQATLVQVSPALSIGATSSATVVIDDDDDVEASFDQSSVTVNEGDGTAVISVSLSGNRDRNMIVNVATAQFSATEGSDYTRVDTALEFLPSETTKSVSIPIVDDDDIESTEDLRVSLTTSDTQINVLTPELTVSITDNDVAQVSLATQAITVQEGDGTGQVIVEITNNLPLGSQIRVKCSLLTSSAGQISDYTLPTGEFGNEMFTFVTFEGGETKSKAVNFGIVDDSVAENEEFFYALLEKVSTNVNLSPNIYTIITIVDNDDVTANFAQAAYSFNEDQTAAIEVVLSNAIEIAVVVSVNTETGTAGESDFAVINREDIEFKAGDMSKFVNVAISDDDIVEVTEKFTLKLTSRHARVNSGLDTTEISITDNDDLSVEFEQSGYTTNENSGSVTLVLSITGVTTTPLSLSLSLQDGTANLNSDYSGVASPIIIEPGVTRKEISVGIVQNNKVEESEKFTATISSSDSRIQVGSRGSTEVTIIDDDEVTVQFQKTVYQVSEGNQIVAVLELTGEIESPVTVRVSTSGVSATSGLDFTPITSQEVTFPILDASPKSVTITTLSDTVLEDAETLQLNVFTLDSNVKIGEKSSATITILDNNVVSAAFQETTVSVDESSGSLIVNVELVGSRTRSVDVTVNSADVTASAGLDYEAIVGQVLTFQPDETIKPLSVTILNDVIFEDSETFKLTLSSSDSQITISNDEILITILENDNVAVRFKEASHTFSEDDSGVNQVDVILSRTASIPVEASISVTDLSTTSNDYAVLTTSVTFQPGETVKQVAFVITDDPSLEDPEAFRLTLIPVTNGLLTGTPSTTDITINDNDDAKVHFDKATYSVNENAGSIDIVLVLDSDSTLEKDVQIGVITQDGTATSTSPIDYSTLDNTVIFESGSADGSQKTITVFISDDSIDEDTEDFTLTLTSVGRGIPSTPSVTTISIVDDDKALVRFDPTTYVVSEEIDKADVLVELSTPAERTITVSYRTVDDTAISGEDYTQVLISTVTFAPGETLKGFPIPIVNDEIIEPVQKFNVDLLERSDIELDQAAKRAEIQITDTDEVTVSLEAVDASVLEFASSVDVRVNVNRLLQKSVSVRVKTYDISANGGVDYERVDEFVTIAAGTSSNTFAVTILNDNVVENEETFGIEVTSTDPRINIPVSTLSVTILDEDKLTLKLTQTIYEVDEGNLLVVEAEVIGQTSVTVNGGSLRVTPNTADSPSDFEPEGTIPFSIQPSEDTKSFPIQTISDTEIEGNEIFSVSLLLTDSSQLVITEPSTAVATIKDDDTISVSFEESSYSFAENAGKVKIPITVTGSTSLSLLVSISASDNTASAVQDYNFQTTLIFLNSLTREVEVEIVDNDKLEQRETFTLTISTNGDSRISAAPFSQAFITIEDDDIATVQFSQEFYTVTEQQLSIPVQLVLQGDLTTSAVVKVSSLPISATATADYSPIINKEITFAPNERTKSLTVNVVDDSLIEGTESFKLVVRSDVSNIVTGSIDETEIRITDNDVASVQFVKTTDNVGESTSIFPVQVSITGQRSLPVTVSVTSSNVDALAGEDFTAVDEQSITFQPVDTEPKTIFISITSDSKIENDETFKLTLRSDSSEVTLGDNVMTVTIIDDDIAVLRMDKEQFVVDESVGTISVQANLIGDNSIPITAILTGEPDTATVGDYLFGAQTVTFNVGENTTTVNIPVISDTIVEDTEAFKVRLTTTDQNAQVGAPDSTTVTITDDDEATFKFQSSTYNVDEDSNVVRLGVVLSVASPIARSLQLSYRTDDGTASSVSDFVTSSGTVVFDANSIDGAVKNIEININDDDRVEGQESFSVSIFSASERFRGVTPTTATVNIIDNDKVTVGFSQPTYTVLESVPSLTVSINLNQRVDRNVDIRVSATPVSATTADYTYPSLLNGNVLTFTPTGPLTLGTSITINNDNLIEGTETFQLSLASQDPDVVVSADRGSTEISIRDDDVVTVTLEVSSVVPENTGVVPVIVRATGPLQKNIPLRVFTYDVSTNTGDYLSLDQQITLDNVNQEQQISLLIFDNSVVENDEVLGINVTTTDEQVNIENKMSLVTIEDDDKLSCSLESPSITVTEGSDTSVVVKAQGTTDVSVSGCTLTSRSDSATAQFDFTPISQGIVFGPGNMQVNVVVRTLGDSLVEGDETFFLDLSTTNSQKVDTTAPKTATVTISDDDFAEVNFVITSASVTENQQSVSVPVRVTGNLATELTVSITTRDGTAKLNEDFESPVGGFSLTFSPSVSTQQDIVIPILDDNRVENTEQFEAVIASVSPVGKTGTNFLSTITIIDDDVAGIGFVLSRAELNENGGPRVIEVEATGGLSKDVTISITLSGGSAEASDYTVNSNPITMVFLANGIATNSFLITPTNDAFVEGDESVTATISTTDASVQINTRVMEILIKDDDKAIATLAAANLLVAEDDGSANIIVNLAGDLRVPVSVSLKSSDGSAVFGDYVPIDNSLTFNPGETQKSTAVVINDDDITEDIESLVVTLSTTDTNVELGFPSQITVEITDNDGASISFQSPTERVSEGDEEVELSIVLTTPEPLQRDAVASFSFTDGTAVSTEDYIGFAVPASIVFSAGDVSGAIRTVKVSIRDDQFIEPTQEFTVNLISNENIIEPKSTTIEIFDNDVASVAFKSDKFMATEDVEDTQVALVVQNRQLLQKVVTVFLTSSDGTAKVGNDYKLVSRNVMIDPADVETIVPIEVIDDNVYEEEETYQLTISNISNDVQIVNPSVAQVVIVDNDDPKVGFEEQDYFVNENDVTRQVCVTTSTVFEGTVVVRATSSSGLAIQTIDFEQVSQELTLGSLSKQCFVVTVIDDNTIEGDETFSISLSTNNPRVEFTRLTTTVHITDDDINACAQPHDCHPNAFCVDTEDSYTCQCNPGFTGDGRSCRDINECIEGGHNCISVNATCVNLEPNFRCDCIDGYTGDGVNFCNDIIDCIETPMQYPCHLYSKCNDVPGGYECYCPDGFIGNGYDFCNDTDECTLGIDECHQFAECKNNPGSYECNCKTGYATNDKDCIEIDECATGQHTCNLATSQCKNTPGSYRCDCNTGYYWDDVICRDIDECSTSAGNDCDQLAICQNSVGSYTCTCPLGYSGDGRQCIDIDECTAGTDNCHVNAKCNNFGGSYECVCEAGYTGSGTFCTDIDECVENPANCPINSTCRNLIPFYECDCFIGFEKIGQQCVDINECANNACSDNSICKNSVGSYACTCNSGYELVNGNTCQDIIECIPTSLDWPCHQKANCLDVAGSFTCTCRDGYSGNGFSCTDEDECALNKDNCHAKAICKNTMGSFECDCQTGFIGNGTHCEDFNECETANRCDPATTTCQDLEGSYLCVCKTGFRRLSDDACVDINECTEGIRICGANARCENSIGSSKCVCNSGYDGDGITCFDIPDCPSSPCHVNAICSDGGGTFTCDCKPGFTGDGFTCVDIIECPDICDEKASCVDTPGSYTCTCNLGYEGSGLVCRDTNECATPGRCPNGRCENFDGSYSCTCNEGYKRENNDCIDVDECLTVSCPANSFCKNLPGLYDCRCDPGYEKDGNTCIDIDECSRGTHNCHASASCTNNAGGYDCACIAGYVGNGTSCANVNECVLGTQDCDLNAVCGDTIGSYSCTCKSGFAGDGRTCRDVLECVDATLNNCHINANCVELPGSFRCECKPGFSGSGVECEDIKECDKPNICHPNADCSETPGSYVCKCKPGFTGDGLSCEDIKECDTNPCGANAKCVEEVGRYTCNCLPGFTEVRGICQDLIECDNNPCDANARCTDTVGSYRCDCNTGFTGNGESCEDIKECDNQGTCHSNADCSELTGSYECKCKPGYTGDGITTCSDINECDNPNACHSQAICTNTMGSFECACKTGYIGDGTTCEDILECDVPNICHSRAKCREEPGSYRCECEIGYTGDGKTNCDDIDECDPSICDDHAKCENNVGSYTCTCLSGFSGNGLTCSDVLECATKPCHENAQCNELLGSYECKCKPGYSGNGTYCEDIDECLGSNDCPTTASCENTIGSYTCTCNSGYTGNGLTCSDLNECNQTPTVCDTDTDRTCDNLLASYRCDCSQWAFYAPNRTVLCKRSLIFNLRFPVVEGIADSEFQSPNSDAYLSLKKRLESAVDKAYGGSSLSEYYLASRLTDIERTTGQTMAHFSVYFHMDAPIMDTNAASNVFMEQLVDNPTINPTHLALSSSPRNFVLYTKGSTNTPLVDYDECTMTELINICGSQRMCINYPGTHDCRCRSPGQVYQNNRCEDVHNVKLTTTILNKDFFSQLGQTNSLPFFQLSKSFEKQILALLNEVYGDNLISVRVAGMRQGSVVVDLVLSFKPGYNNGDLSNLLITNELTGQLAQNSTGAFAGPYMLEKDATAQTDYNECDPANHLHIKDCDPNAECKNSYGTYNCTCRKNYHGDGRTCTEKPQIIKPTPSDDDLWWLVYVIVFCIAFLIIMVLILILCCMECSKESRYLVDDDGLVHEKNQYFFNQESVGVVDQDIELSSRAENRDIYTTPTRMESYKVNPMFNEEKSAGSQYGSNTRMSINNEGYITS